MANLLKESIKEWIQEKGLPLYKDKNWFFSIYDTPVILDDEWEIGFMFYGEINGVKPDEVGVVLYDNSISDIKGGDPQEYSTTLKSSDPSLFSQIEEILEKKCESHYWGIKRYHWWCSDWENCDNQVDFREDGYSHPRMGLCGVCWNKKKYGICAKLNICPECCGFDIKCDRCDPEEAALYTTQEEE